MKAVGSTGGRASPDPPAWLFGLGRGGGGRCQEGDLRNVAGSADTHIFLLPGSQLAGTEGRARSLGQGTQPGRGPGAGWS